MGGAPPPSTHRMPTPDLVSSTVVTIEHHMVSGVIPNYHAHRKVVKYAVQCIVDESIDRWYEGILLAGVIKQAVIV